MNIIKLFLTALVAVSLLVSCSKEGEKGTVDTTPATLQIKLSYGDPNDVSTYAVENTLTEGKRTTITSALLYQMIGEDVFQVVELTSEQVTALSSPTGYRMENVNGTVNALMIVGNPPAGKGAEMKKLMTKDAISKYAIEIVSQQSTAGAVGVQHVTVMGYGTATTAADPSSADHAGHTYKVVNITDAAPVVARMQIFGTVASSTEETNQIKTITWKEVSFARYYTTGARTSLLEYNKDNWATLPDWAKDAYVGASTEGKTNCYAYQFFPGLTADAALLPIIVLKADIELKKAINGSSKWTDRYITIKTYSKNSNPLTQMFANRIYNVDLSNLTVDHTDFTEDPNPDQVDLAIKVEVLPWVVEAIIPQI